MWIKNKGGGSDNINKDFFVFKGLLWSVLALVKHIWYYFAYSYKKEKKKSKTPIVNHKKEILELFSV